MKKYRSIRLARITVAALTAAGVTLCVALGARCLPARMQIVPAIMAGSAAWLLLWTFVTMLLGRLYCSTVCPAGVLMDAVARLRMTYERWRKGHITPYRHIRPHIRSRYSVLAVVALCMMLGFSVIPSLFDPYSAYARIVAALRSFVALPVGRATGIAMLSAVVATATLAVFVAVSWRGGRYLCNTWCPVGSALGAVSRYALYHPDVNTDLCVRCRRCVDVCKASCIEPDNMTVDASRCVVCFDCMDVCATGAISYRRGQHRLATPLMQRVGAASAAASMDASSAPVRLDRRKFLKLGIVAAATGATAVMSAASQLRSGRHWDPRPLEPLNYPLPPGFGSRRDFLRRCTACGACVAACPTGVIQPSVRQYGVQHAMQPVMLFGNVACRTDCNACTRVCPTGALVPLTMGEKHRFVIGKAHVSLQNCLSYGRDRTCGRCERRCPSGAITMTRFDNGRRGPSVALDVCVGCGQCVAACPSHPYKAIVIEGME